MNDNQIPELTQHHRDLMTMGLCPFCEAAIRVPFTLLDSGAAGYRVYLCSICTGTISFGGHHSGHSDWCPGKRLSSHTPDCPHPEITLA